MHLPAILKGTASFVLPGSVYSRHTGGSDSARYCYSVFLRHLSILGRLGLDTPLSSVAELGPGDSLGIGIAAVVAGAERYRAFDVKAFAANDRNLAVFDELTALFRDRAPIPSESEFPEIKPPLDAHDFPSDLLNHARLEAALLPGRIERLRREIAAIGTPGEGCVSYAAPWHDDDRIAAGSVDWILSQAVMEHVDDLEGTYAACWRWLRPGGVMSHQIDFKSHGTAPQWNGHWAFSDFAWRLVRGARPYLINRQPHSVHVDLMMRAGFEILCDRTFRSSGGLPRERLAGRYRSLSDDDLATSGAFIVARKPLAA